VGPSAQATQTGGVALGNDAQATGSYGVALGCNARASASNSVALGAGSVCERELAVSVGTGNVRRQIVNVAEATQAGDAVPLVQLDQYVKALKTIIAARESEIRNLEKRVTALENKPTLSPFME